MSEATRSKSSQATRLVDLATATGAEFFHHADAAADVRARAAREDRTVAAELRRALRQYLNNKQTETQAKR